MINLNEYLIEALTPKFENSHEGISEFCEYVFDQEFVKWAVNPDLTITLEPVGRSINMYMDTKNLTEIPEFIVFSNIQNVALALGTDSACKIKTWKPKVNGFCKGIVVENRPKVTEIDLSDCEIRDGMLHVVQAGVKSITNAHGEGVQVFIKKNKNLETLDVKNCKTSAGSYIQNNAKLDIKPSDLPEGIRVQNNAQKEKIYIS